MEGQRLVEANPLRFSSMSAAETQPSVRARMNLPFYKEGSEGPSLFSAKARNQEVALLRAYANPSIERGERDQVILADGNVKFVIASNAAGSGAVSMFKLKDVASDWLICHSWDGTTEGTTSVLVAKDAALRNSLASETILGVAHTYTYSAGPSEAWSAGTDTRYNKTRTDNDGTLSEAQRVIRPYVENEIIFAASAPTGLVDGTGAAITLLEIKPWRQWAGPIT